MTHPKKSKPKLTEISAARLVYRKYREAKSAADFLNHEERELGVKWEVIKWTDGLHPAQKPWGIVERKVKKQSKSIASTKEKP